MTTMPDARPRTCPRCGSRLFHSQDRFGRYSSCWTCGFVHEWVSDPALELPGDSGTPQRLRTPMCEGRAI